MDALKQARRAIKEQRLALLAELDRLRGEQCPKCNGVYGSEANNCSCPASVRIREIGQELLQLSVPAAPAAPPKKLKMRRKRSMTEKSPKLTVYEYKALKHDQLTDRRIADMYDMSSNDLNTWKRRNDLVGWRPEEKEKPAEKRVTRLEETDTNADQERLHGGFDLSQKNDLTSIQAVTCSSPETVASVASRMQVEARNGMKPSAAIMDEYHDDETSIRDEIPQEKEEESKAKAEEQPDMSGWPKITLEEGDFEKATRGLTVNVKITDLPQFQNYIRDLKEQVKDLQAERDDLSRQLNFERDLADRLLGHARHGSLETIQR